MPRITNVFYRASALFYYSAQFECRSLERRKLGSYKVRGTTEFIRSLCSDLTYSAYAYGMSQSVNFEVSIPRREQIENGICMNSVLNSFSNHIILFILR